MNKVIVNDRGVEDIQSCDRAGYNNTNTMNKVNT